MSNLVDLLVANLVFRQFLHQEFLNDNFPKELLEEIYREEKEKILEKILSIFLGAFFGLIILLILLNVFFEENVNRDWIIFLPFVVLSALIMIGSIIATKLKYKKQIRKKFGTIQSIQKEISELKEKDAYIVNLVEHSFDNNREDGYINLQKVISEFYLEILIASIEDEIIKADFHNKLELIINGKFILESLEISILVEKKDLYEKFLEILTDFETALKDFSSTKKEIIYFKKEILKFAEKFDDVKSILVTLSKIHSDKQFSSQIESKKELFRKLTLKKPVSRVQLSKIDSIKGLTKNQTYTALSALDEDVFEIRTKAGIFYANLHSIANLEILPEKKKFELLTENELIVKLQVLENTLILLDSQKDNLDEEEYSTIRSENLRNIFTIKEILEKRKNKGKSVLCPYCNTQTSPILSNCQNCNKELPYCMICLNRIGSESEVSICPHCSSIAHGEHFEKWLKITNSCPYCKKEIIGKIPKNLLIEIKEKSN
ncbi:MAG: RING finger domain-containing protein [Candidatus Thorarchaeota archaeon]